MLVNQFGSKIPAVGGGGGFPWSYDFESGTLPSHTLEENGAQTPDGTYVVSTTDPDAGTYASNYTVCGTVGTTKGLLVIDLPATLSRTGSTEIFMALNNRSVGNDFGFGITNDSYAGYMCYLQNNPKILYCYKASSVLSGAGAALIGSSTTNYTETTVNTWNTLGLVITSTGVTVKINTTDNGGVTDTTYTGPFTKLVVQGIGSYTYGVGTMSVTQS